MNNSIVTSEYGFEKVGYGITPTCPTEFYVIRRPEVTDHTS